MPGAQAWKRDLMLVMVPSWSALSIRRTPELAICILSTCAMHQLRTTSVSSLPQADASRPYAPCIAMLAAGEQHGPEPAPCITCISHNSRT